MGFDKIYLNSPTREIELSMVNSIAQFLRGFNDSLLVENELDMEEIRLLDNIFRY
ncbi:hypothetical protein CRYPA_575 [uncultured Candidatus Thioglobus sp.]|uniref:hypothetical protein n=1 Tax=Bathymodiolus heckerae thiotrophic gill symbiont TaxID=1052212 RepID=UPI0010BA3015|nr:hypothetical protein [Bathymodiolus heckerae thiotrophic gill symbiont]CAC9536508.1 hypothetical protein [uncultured Gammaproteobacteria bacterium]SHN89256.1 hypothetical protein BHECKSOX_1525 [Bathymodiolus heckerae thiotrophic gill symbiont]SMN16940.1 hypothetical protein CRYPA_575 [uncultured Candidatus Thioglobus sp.]